MDRQRITYPTQTSIVNTKRTVSDAKRTFFSTYPRPLNSIYRRVIDELLVELHLLVINQDFRYDPLFATGITVAYGALMDGYKPADQREPILRAMCKALDLDYERIQQDTRQWRSLDTNVPAQEVLEVLSGTREPVAGPLTAVRATFDSIAGNTNFKYSRMFTLGLSSIVEQVGRAALLGDKDRQEKLQQICKRLRIDSGKVKKDLDFFNAVIERIKRSKETIDELVQSDRRKREERAASQTG